MPILWGMLRTKRARFRTLDVPLAARNRALDYLAKNYRLTDELRYQLTEVVNATVRGRRRASCGRSNGDAVAISRKAEGQNAPTVLEARTLARNRTSPPERTSRCPQLMSKAPAGFSFPPFRNKHEPVARGPWDREKAGAPPLEGGTHLK